MYTQYARAVVIPFLFILILLSLLPNTAHALVGINKQIPFYGTLERASGDVVVGPIDMVFRIYDASENGTVLWTGTHTSANGNPVIVEDESFKVLLGSGAGNEITLDFNDDTYYLGVTIDTDDEMIPRERLGGVGYAFNADTVDGVDASAFLRAGIPLSITEGLGSVNTLLALDNQGTGNFFSLTNNGDPVLSIPYSGELIVSSPDTSRFGGNIQLADGSGILLGNETSGISMYQDAFGIGMNELMLDLRGDALNSNYLNILTPKGLGLIANAGVNGGGNEEPRFSLNENGSVELYNTQQGDPLDRVFYINLSNGMTVANGDLRIENGMMKIGGGDPEEALHVDGTIRSSSLAGGFALESDALGNIIPSPSDGRLKENIRTIEDSLDTILNLRGVRYEWKDTERFGTQTEVGFVAQELESVLPEVVHDTGEYLSVDVKNITAVLVESIKELYTLVTSYTTRTEKLEAEVATLKAELEALKDGDREPQTHNDIEPVVEEVVVTPTETLVPEEAVIVETEVSEPINENSIETIVE